MPLNPPYNSNLTEEDVKGQLASLGQTQSQPPYPLLFTKNSFNGGELSPEMAARFDLPKYQNGCHSLLNMIPMTTGGITKRPPLRYIKSLGSEAGPNSRHSRLIPFVYSTSLQFMLILSYSYSSGSCRLMWIDRDGLGELGSGPNLPYKEQEIYELSYCQCGKVIYLAHPNYLPAKLVCISVSGGRPNFIYEKLDFRIKTPTPGKPGIFGWGQWQNDLQELQTYVITGVNRLTGEESLPSQKVEWNCPPTTMGYFIGIYPYPGETDENGSPNFDVGPTAMSSGGQYSEFRVYKKKGGSYGYIGRIVPGQSEFVDNGIVPDIADPPPANPENCFDRPGDYPGIVFIHQQRLGWAASENNPLTIWMSQASNFECRASKQPPNDDDAIEATLASTEANRILWAIPDRSGLAIGTEGGEWYLTGAGGEAAVSPNSLEQFPLEIIYKYSRIPT